MTKLILDLDTGIDDAMALAYALASPGLDLIAVTGTYGNVLVETGVRNARALLDMFGRPDIPVLAGPDHAWAKESFAVTEISEFIHGRNGIGEAEVPPSSGAIDPRGAVDFIIAAYRQHGADLVIVPTGPSTTIAAAIRQAPEVAHARIVMMGGALTAPGNVTPWSEANISQDPESTDYLFRHGKNVTMVGLDVTLQTLLTSADIAAWRDLDTVGGKVLFDAATYYINAYKTTSPHIPGCGLHDPLAVAVAEDPSLVTLLDINMKTELEGATRGRTIGDDRRLSEYPKCAHVAVGVDVARFVARFLDRLTAVAAQTAPLRAKAGDAG